MTTLVKICGLSDPVSVNAALTGGAAMLGFVFFDRSPRNVTPNLAAQLSAAVQGRARRVAVVVDPTDAEIDRIASVFAPDLYQLHGKETPARVREVSARTGAGVIKAISVSEPADLDAAAAFEPVVDHLMFDARPPKGSDLPGGVGARFDWDMLKGRRFQRPYLLAGGLDPWSVGDAIARSGAPMVDVSSGVERGPGIKDAALITAFLDAVRKAQA